MLFRSNSGLVGSATPYSFTVTDAHGCVATATVTLVNPPALAITNITRVNPSCNGATDGSITVTTTGGTPGLTFSNGLSTTAGTSPFVFANQAGGDFIITVTDAHGCLATGNTTLTASAILRPRASVDVSRVCLPGIVTFDGTASTTTVGTIVTYDWAFGDGNTGTGAQASNTYAAAGTYNVTLTITSSTGCVYDSTFVAMVTALPDAVADFTSTPTRDEYINTENAEIRFEDLSQNAVRWLWDFGNGDTTTRQNPTFRLPAGITCVGLTVFNDAVLNCPHTDTLCYNVVEEGIHVPTAFIPGGSGANAFFHPFTHEVFESYEMRIYDRWGIEIAAFSDILPGWDGKKNGTIVPEGVYTYRIVFKRRNSTENQERTGTVTVLH